MAEEVYKLKNPRGNLRSAVIEVCEITSLTSVARAYVKYSWTNHYWPVQFWSKKGADKAFLYAKNYVRQHIQSRKDFPEIPVWEKVKES